MNNHQAAVHQAATAPRGRRFRRPGQQSVKALSGPTVGEYLDSWLSARRTLRPSTRLAYEIHLRKHLGPHLGDLPLATLALEDIEAMYIALAEAPDRQGRPLTPATVRRIHATLMSALTSAVRRGILERNPAEHVELARATAPRMQVWTADQLSTFLTLASDDSSHPLFLLLALTGLRRGEAIGLRWVDLDLDQKLLHVEQQIVAVAGNRHTGPPKSANGRRTLALPDRLVIALEHHRVAQEQQRSAAGDSWTHTALVFATVSGAALEPVQVSRRFTKLAAASGLPVVRLHDLRHTSASLGLASGESLVEVSRRLGHSSITITADVYSHISPATARTSAERLDYSIRGDHRAK
jgi:integrase